MRDLKNFKAGKWIMRLGYQSFSPEIINEEWLVTHPALLTLLSKADRNLGKLDAFSDLIPDVDCL